MAQTSTKLCWHTSKAQTVSLQTQSSEKTYHLTERVLLATSACKDSYAKDQDKKVCRVFSPSLSAVTLIDSFFLHSFQSADALR